MRRTTSPLRTFNSRVIIRRARVALCWEVKVGAYLGNFFFPKGR